MISTILLQTFKNSKFWVLILAIWCISCAKTLDTADPKQSFTKIYNENSFSNAITAIDVVETETGYLLLGMDQVPDKQFPSISILVIDKEGKVVKQTPTAAFAQFVAPAKGIFKFNTNYRFLAMDSITTQAYMLEVDTEGNLISNTPLAIQYPLCIGLANDGSYLVQGFNQSDRATTFAKYSTSLTEAFNKKYDILETADEFAIGHISNNGKRYPFAVGQTSTGEYYFNGFRNFSFSLVFVSNSDQKQTRVVNGYRYSGGMNSITPIDGNTFAISRFYFGDNYINAKATLSSSAVSASTDVSGRRMLELEPDAIISASRLTVGGKKVLFFASTTVNKQIVLYVYDEVSGSLIDSKYFGLNIPCENGALTLTSDGGLLIVGSAYIDGRFKRICAFKLAASQLEDMVN